MIILMLGTKIKGGMATVIDAFLNSKLKETYDLVFIPTHLTKNPLKRISTFFFALVKSMPYFFKSECEIIHLHTSFGGSLVRKIIFIFIAKLFRKKIILHTHGGAFFDKYANYRQVTKKVIHYIFNLPDVLIVSSELRKHQYSAFVPEERIFVLHNFIKINMYQKNPDPEKTNLFYIGIHNREKGIDDVLRVIQRINNNNFSMNFVGFGEIDKYKDMAMEMGISKKVNFMGWISAEEKEKVLVNGDICVLPSYFEDFPMTVLESIAYSNAILATDVGGIPEMVKDGRNGLLSKPGDIDTLAKNMETMINDFELRKKFGEESYRIYEQNFSEDIVVNKIDNIYKSMLR